MKLNRLLLVILLAFNLNAHAALFGNNSDNAKQQFKEAEDCFDRLKNDGDLAILSDKVGLSTADVSLLYLANDAKPSPQEADVLVKWAAKRDVCFKIRSEAMKTFFPNDPRSAISQENYDQVNKLILGLYKGNLSYGEFNLQRKDISTQFQKRISAFSPATSQQSSDQDKCAIARQNMTQFCNQANNALHPPGSNVTVNIDGNSAYSNTPVGHADIQASIQCGHWQAEVNQVCK